LQVRVCPYYEFGCKCHQCEVRVRKALRRARWAAFLRRIADALEQPEGGR
jgi:hypothetical protein